MPKCQYAGCGSETVRWEISLLKGHKKSPPVAVCSDHLEPMLENLGGFVTSGVASGERVVDDVTQ